MKGGRVLMQGVQGHQGVMQIEEEEQRYVIGEDERGNPVLTKPMVFITL